MLKIWGRTYWWGLQAVCTWGGLNSGDNSRHQREVIKGELLEQVIIGNQVAELVRRVFRSIADQERA